MADFSKFSDGNNVYNVKDAQARSNIDSHVVAAILGSTGLHGIRYYEGQLSYKDGEGNWVVIETGAGVIEVTQAEYDALPTADKQKDVIYIITDSTVMPADNSRIDVIEDVVGLKNKVTTFNADGSITENLSLETVNTVFNADGSITETRTNKSTGAVKTKTVTFSGSSISETITESQNS